MASNLNSNLCWSSYILRRPQNFTKYSPPFWLQYIQSKVRWRFRKILWPSQSIWTLPYYYWKLNPPNIWPDTSVMFYACTASTDSIRKANVHSHPSNKQRFMQIKWAGHSFKYNFKKNLASLWYLILYQLQNNVIIIITIRYVCKLHAACNIWI